MQSTCSIEGCEKPVARRGWCNGHYLRFLRHGDPLIWKKRKRKFCTVNDCGRPSVGHSMCSQHYQAWKKHGDPLYDSRKGGYVRGGYWVVCVDGREVPEHRLVMEQVLGRPLLEIEIVHHIDGDKLNNAPDNLMAVTRFEHSQLHVKHFRSETHKECSTCHEVLPRTDFYVIKKPRREYDLHWARCKACNRRIQRERDINSKLPVDLGQ